MKNNRPQRKRKAVAKRAKKAKTHPLTEFEGKEYTGLREDETWSVGRGQWKENRRSQKSWDFLFETIALKEFKGSKAMPLGSEFHSFVLAHQTLVKTRNNTYKVKLEGKKFKLAHREEGSTWSSNALARKNALIKILKDMLLELEMGHGQAPAEVKTKPVGKNARDTE